MARLTTPYVQCNGCGKRGYHSKQDAKRIRRILHEDGLSVYRCVACPDLWHIGHLPGKVLDGRVARNELGISMRRNP